MMENIEMQKYLLDLQGYLVVENALSTDEVTILNALFDRRNPMPSAPEEGPRFAYAPDGSGFLTWGKPFCDLLDHAVIMPILRFRLEDCFRLDRLYGISVKGELKAGHLHSDYGASAPCSRSVPGEYFHFSRHEITDGFMVVLWNLTDGGARSRGLLVYPWQSQEPLQIA